MTPREVPEEVPEEVRARLRAAAGAHRPDRARMLARIERGRAAGDRPGPGNAPTPRGGWVRVAGATVAVAGVLAVCGYGVASVVREDPPPRRTVAASPAPAPRTPAPAARGGRDGPLSSGGAVDPHSNAFWAQSEVTLSTTRPLTSLRVRLAVAQTGGVTSTGAWRTLPEDDFTLTARERAGFLVFTWTLRAGRTVPAGDWIFAGQYDHDRGGRDAGDDRYTITGTADDGQRATVTGDFTAR
ncbi:hypothetical protein ABZ922_23705 [Streptomyces shenzhenensis]|uniref:hypothetical protein n=1 Tax=Streptomyces shenzhenensis TaxID=943815 RepID=UPI0033CA9D8B